MTKPKKKPAKKKKTKKTQKSVQLNFWQQLSVNRRLDLIGIFLVVLGLFTFLSLTSITRSPFTDWWIVLLSHSFGWGKWLFPLGITTIGVWLFVRNQESIPYISVERLTGIFLLFFWTLAILQSMTQEPLEDFRFADKEIGGGYFGSILLRALVFNLGGFGATIAFLAWLLIALTLMLDMTVSEFFGHISPPFRSLAKKWKESLAKRQTEKKQIPDLPSINANGYLPSQRNSENAAQPHVQLGVSSKPSIDWTLPAISEILDFGSSPNINEEYIEQRALLITETLESFGAPVKVVEINRGPTITQFGVEPGFIQTRKGKTRVRVNKITSLADDLALALAASRIRIEAPVPGKGYIGIEVPNEEMTIVALRDILDTEEFKKKQNLLSFVLGRDVAGHPQIADLTAMPHLLIAGTTGSGKSVCINSILTSLLLYNTPKDLRLVLVDPKRVELTGYNGIPHLLAPVVVETERVVGALQWMTREMDKRYHAFSQTGTRNIDDYNRYITEKGGNKFPYLVIVIDELADLMMIAPDETERTITRLAQLARATGIHMILATQRPSTDVVTGLIKANFPARIAFAVASGVDSRVILDQSGAERLLGRGDMLYQAPDAPSALRLQGVFVSDAETERLVEFWRIQAGLPADSHRQSGASSSSDLPQGAHLKQADMFEDEMMEAKKIDILYDDAVDLVRRQGRASVSMLQRKLRIGYTRASRLIDAMEDEGIVSAPTGGTGVREILDYGKAGPPAEG